jgi:hypothetical protein
MVVMFVVVVVFMSLDRLPSLALVDHHCGQLPHMLPPRHGTTCGQWCLQAPASWLALLGSVLVFLVPEGSQGGKEGWAGSQMGRGGYCRDSRCQWGLASCPSGYVAHTHIFALGLRGPHKVLAPVLGAPESLLKLRDLGEWGVKKVEGARVRTLGLPVWDVDGFWLMGARSSGVGGARGQF